MKTKGIGAKIDVDGDIVLSFKIDKKYNSEVDKFLQIKEEELHSYDLKFTKNRKKRSLDANAYCWVLCKKIADVLFTTDEEIYRQMIARYGVWEIVPVMEQKIKEKIELYSRQSIGGQAVDIGECRGLKGYHNIKHWFGSSSYNTQQMGVFLDGIVNECMELEIETIPSDELERLKKMWR